MLEAHIYGSWSIVVVWGMLEISIFAHFHFFLLLCSEVLYHNDGAKSNVASRNAPKEQPARQGCKSLVLKKKTANMVSICSSFL